MSARVLKARKQLAAQFVKCFSSTIQDYEFPVGLLVLVHSSCIERSSTTRLSLVSLAHGGCPLHERRHIHLTSWIVLSQSSDTWLLSHSVLVRLLDHIPVTSLLDETELEDLQLHSEGFLAADIHLMAWPSMIDGILIPFCLLKVIPDAPLHSIIIKLLTLCSQLYLMSTFWLILPTSLPSSHYTLCTFMTQDSVSLALKFIFHSFCFGLTTK